MFNPQTSPDTGNATSSPASPAGPLQLDLLGGPTTASSGPAAPRASRSPSRVKAKPRMTIGTCGPTSFASSVPDGPLSSWENRLRRRLARTGSTECLLTWKQRTTPAGRSLSQLVPSTRPIAGIDSGLWPTPMAHEARLGYQRRRGDTKGSQESLTTVVVNVSAPLDDPRIAGLWPTPTASLADKGVRSTEGAIREVARGHGPDLAAVAATALWPTPTAQDGNRGNATIRPTDTGIPLPQRVLQVVTGHPLGLYPTPRASANENRTTKIPPSQLDGRHGLYLSSVAIGMEPAGSSATTENSGALNPAFVCWLMGFRPEWDACAPTATPSSRKSPRK